jgi:hypothetical protein
MAKLLLLAIIFCLVATVGFSQSDAVSGKVPSDIFNRLTSSVKDYRLDTTAAPDDKVTRKITELRNLKGGFNINEAIEFKIEEDRQKKEVPKEELDKVSEFFKTGYGKRWLDNAVVWIYRRHFTYKELRQLVKFYKTSAGQKLAADFPVIMMQSLRAAEMIKDTYTLQQKK